MGRFLARRLLQAIPLLLGVVTLAFVLVEAAPGDAADVLIGERPVSPEVRARIEAAYGLDRPPLERYASWIGHVLRGDLGWSLSRGRPAAAVLGNALPPTISLAALALLIEILAGLALGMLHALRPHGLLDHALGAAGLALASIPSFWLGLMAILLFAYAIPLFPASSSHAADAALLPPVARAWDALRHAALPALVLGSGGAAVLARFLRARLLETQSGAFVRAARARGASPSRLLARHALRASLGPVITVAGLSLPLLVSGSLVVEVVFGWPGMGRATYDAILAEDIPVALASVVLATAVVVAGNLLADLALAWADPRVRLGARGER